jgi:hypothetical protein
MPWLFGFAHWRRASFAKNDPTKFVPIGSASAASSRLGVVIPPDVAQGLRIIGLRVTPAGVSPTTSAPLDEEQRKRLRALGYVQ